MTDNNQNRVIPFAPLAAVNHDPKSVTDQDGATPWRVVGGHKGMAAILDANNKTLLTTTARIAGRIVAAVNLVECAYRDVKRVGLAQNIFDTVIEPCRKWPNQNCVYPIGGGKCVHCGGGDGAL